MKKLVLAAMFFVAAKGISQVKVENVTFEVEARNIGNEIKNVIKTQKDSLKIELEQLNSDYNNGKISLDEMNKKKLMFSEKRAKINTEKINLLQIKLNELVQKKVEGKLSDYNNGEEVFLSFKFPKKYRVEKVGEKRRTSQFVFAFGVNNTLTDNKFNDDKYKFWASHYYEFGVNYNYRLFPNDNLLHLKYGLSLQYNNLRPSENRFFEVNDKETNLETHASELAESRLRNVQLVLPLYFEIDATPKKVSGDKTIFKTNQSFRLGFGGYAGVALKSKQKLEFDSANGKTYQKELGDFNTSDFIYGLGAYVGYKDMSLYAKMDLNPLFKNNLNKEQNVSLALRWDVN